MKTARWLAGISILILPISTNAQDWPQWRGPNRDAKVTGFTAPKEWPKELTKKWKESIGDGVATPALVGDKLYVFTRQGANEIIRCLNAADGKEVWQDKYDAQGATGPASGFPGPRSSPTVANGKVITLGVRGKLSCLDAEKGKEIWRKDEVKGFPMFFTSSSPIVVDGLCIAQLGGRDNGALIAYDLATGNEKWKWAGDGTAYASPSLLTVKDGKAIIAETDKQIVAINAADGKLLWKTPFEVPAKQRGYNAATPMVDGQTLIYAGSGRGTKAVKMEPGTDGLTAKDLWSNSDQSVIYNTPILKNGFIYGLSDGNSLFCINAKDGKNAWTSALGDGKGRSRGYGSIVDAGDVLFALTPAATLVVFEPNEKEFKQLASYKVADGDTYAYPIIADKRIFIKDKDSITLWTIE